MAAPDLPPPRPPRQVRQRRPRTSAGWAAQAVASAVLVAWAWFMSIIPWAVAISLSCDSHCEPTGRDPLVLTDAGGLLYTYVPLYGSIGFALLALIGTWAWPRRPYFLLVGFVGALVCAGIGVAMVSIRV